MFADYSPGRPRPQGSYWFAVRSADKILWSAAHTLPRINPRITVRRKIWSYEEVYYSYTAAQPHELSAGNLGTRVGAVVLCTNLEVKDKIEQFGRKLIQYQISDILGDDVCHVTFSTFDVPLDAPAQEKAEQIDTMLTPDAHPEGESLDGITSATYIILSRALQFGASGSGEGHF